MLTQELRFETGHATPVGELIVHEQGGLMAPGDLRRLVTLPVTGGLFPAFAGHDPIGADASLWDRLRADDLLVHHPYDDFAATTLRLLEEAAEDPDVVAIKMTLYRAGERSPIVEAPPPCGGGGEGGRRVRGTQGELRRSPEHRVGQTARARGCAGCLRAGWPQESREGGAGGAPGGRQIPPLRPHRHRQLQRRDARHYTDIGLLSADPALGDDLSDLFNQLTGSSRAPGAALRCLLVAPERLLPGLLERIEREAEHARSGRPARLRAKLNGLDDPEVIRALYDASEAGVEIDLVVRGLCTLKPGVPGLSDRIRVRSLVGRFLEHARIYHFGNGGADEYLIGSADWRSRNLRRRVEVVTAVIDPACRTRLDAILTRELEDPSAWVLAADGSYHQAHALPVGDPATAQARAIMPPDPAAEEETVWTG